MYEGLLKPSFLCRMSGRGSKEQTLLLCKEVQHEEGSEKEVLQKGFRV